MTGVASGGGSAAMPIDVVANRPLASAFNGFWYAVDQGQLYYSNGVRWLTMGTNDVPTTLRSGMYTPVRPSVAVNTTGTPNNQRLVACPFPVGRDVTLTRITGECTAAGDAGSALRLGIYADDGFGRPSALMLDAGTIPTDAVGLAEIVINLALTAGLYWAAAVIQGAPGTLPTLRMSTVGMVPLGSSTVPAANNLWAGFAQLAVAGALPNPMVPLDTTLVTAIPNMYVKAA